MTPPVVLSIAGTDSGGAAGLAADLATFAALGVHGACVVTAVTAQDTTGVRAVHAVPLDIVAAQLEAVLVDLPVAVVKTGMLADPAVVRLVAERCAHLPLVVDPVLRATTGARLADSDVLQAYRDDLLPAASVVTPNVAEAAVLLGRYAEPDHLAADLAGCGPAVVVTGGDAGTGDCVDWLAVPGHAPEPLSHPRVPTGNDHGTGCTFSAALAVGLLPEHPPKPPAHTAGPRSGPALDRLRWIVRQAAAFTAAQLRISSSWDLGRGRGPIAHLTSPTTTAHITTGGTR